MLINRTYRTWVYDYKQFYSENKMGQNSQGTNACPNNISSLATDIALDGDFIASSFLTVNLNNTTGNNTNYIFLYDGDFSGYTYDSTRPLFGNIADSATDVISNGFIRLPVSGNTYYIRRYLGPPNRICSTSLRCSVVPQGEGSFVSAGYAIVLVDGMKKFIKLYTME